MLLLHKYIIGNICLFLFLDNILTLDMQIQYMFLRWLKETKKKDEQKRIIEEDDKKKKMNELKEARLIAMVNIFCRHGNYL